MEDRHDDIIELNVGGQLMTTKRSTLCQIDGSLLATMFSGRWEDSMSRDKDGRIFLDFNPIYFGFILDYLREKKISSPDNPATLPKIASNELKFSKLVEYLGLRNELFPEISETFKEHSQGIKLEENGTVAAFYSLETKERSRYGRITTYFIQRRNEFAFGKNIYEHGIIRLKLSIDAKFGSNGCSFMLGVVPTEVTPEKISDNYRDTKNFYGWVIDGNSLGISVFDQTHRNLFHLGTSSTLVFELILDFNTRMVFFKSHDGCQHDLMIPRWNSWRFFTKFGSDRNEKDYTPTAIRVGIIQSKKEC